ncbi:MAG: discoidin domain-containing protein [Novosphingobium sp.]
MTVFSTIRKALLISAISASAVAANAAPTAGAGEDYFSFASGAWIVRAPEGTGMSQMESSPLNLIDGSASTDWTDEAGEAVFVFELAELTELSRIAFDTAGLNRDQKAPGDFTVEVSESGANSGYTQVMSGKLKMAQNGQSFAFKPEDRPQAKWVRLTILNNHGDDYQGFTGFHGYGKQLTQTATLPDLSGRYEGASGWGRVNLTDTDSGVSGCYEFQKGEFKGTVDGRVLKVDMIQRENGERLKGMFQMAPGGRKLVGLVRTEGSAHRDAYAYYYSAEKLGGKAGSC